MGAQVVDTLRRHMERNDLMDIASNNYSVMGRDRRRVLGGRGSMPGSKIVADVWPALFDLLSLNLEARTLSIRGNATAEVAIAGAWYALTNGTGFGARSSNTFAATLASGTATHFVWINANRAATNTATIAAGLAAAMASAIGDGTEVFPLWQIGVVGTAISRNTIVDLRGTKHWVAGA